MSKSLSPRVVFSRAACAAALILATLTLPRLALGDPATPIQAERLVSGWLQRDSAPLEAPLGARVTEVQTFAGDDGLPAYYVVYLAPQGFAIVPADDLVEPVIAFAADGQYLPGTDNPLGALVASDLPSRLVEARRVQTAQRSGQTAIPAPFCEAARQKWQWLLSDPPDDGGTRGLSSVSDPRVSPLTQSHWNQTTAGSSACYNYYTPPNAAGSSSNYPSGCVATAMAQFMRFHQYPTAGVGAASFDISICGTYNTRALRGGDGAGGPYVWANMVLAPSGSTTTAQRQAIGALCHDAGVAVGMDFCSGGSGADTLAAAIALRTTFGYSNARNAWNNASELPSDARNRMANANLDAGFPVIFGITGSAGGHAVVGDGYGYNAGTLYHHLNMGWSGSSDAWYNLPNIDSSPSFTTLYKLIYNVYVTGSGEIVSGRVLDPNGNPLADATVTAGSYSDVSDSRGIYALAKIPSGTQFTLTAQKTGYTFAPQTVTTGTSSDYSTTCGNLWGVNLAPCTTPVAPTSALADPNTACAGQSVTLSAAGGSGGTLKWYVGDCGSGTSIGSGGILAITAPATTTTYYVRREGACGNSTCATVVVNVPGPPTAPTAVSADPNAVCPGQSVTLTATGGTGGTVTWYEGGCGSGTSIGSGASIMIPAPASATTYHARIEGTCGNSACVSTTVTVNAAPAISAQPGNPAVCSGGSASFSVTATGAPAPSYQWRRGTSNLVNGGNISGATTASLTINPVGPADAATNYNCLITNVCDFAASNNATLTVNVGPTIGDQPDSQALVIGSSASFTVTASGTHPLSYQWRKDTAPLANGGSISGATTQTLTINPVAAGDAGRYDVVVTNTCGPMTSSAAAFWLRGDMNCDGAVNYADINPLVMALSSQSKYETRWPNCRHLNADINGDSLVNYADINPFVALLGTRD